MGLGLAWAGTVAVVAGLQRDQRRIGLERARRRLVRVSRLRIIEASVAVLVACALARVVGTDWQVVLAALGASALVGLAGDARVRRAGAKALGPDPSNAAPLVIKHALREAARPLGIDDRRIFARHMRGRGEASHVGFAAGAIPVEQGAILLMGDVVTERSRDAMSPSATDGERRFAYDEIRAVLGHELAHTMPGTHASARFPSVVSRASSIVIDITFWIVAIASDPWIGAGCAASVAIMRMFVKRVPQLLGVVNALNCVIAALVTVFVTQQYLLAVVYLVWPFVRPLPALMVQRRIEHWCDQVAVCSGADPSALARMLQRFEPEVLRYYQPPLWIALNATHPPLHKRIVDLDHSTSC